MNIVGKLCNKRIVSLLRETLSKRYLHGECLENRSLVSVSGKETQEFLQGLITNDIEHLDVEKPTSSMYAMFLNVQGRVLFDSILYKPGEESLIIDCDSQAVQPLINHMKLYKVRRKISFEKIKNLKVWVLYDNELDLKALTDSDFERLYLNPKGENLSHLKDCSALPSEAIITRDPRLQYLGDRIILPADKSLKNYLDFTSVEGGFDRFRFKLGIGEGVNDLARGKCLPLEANCDFLHGVSFQKGCYIGQELTARTYHTGVIRKRFMPLIFDRRVDIETNSVVTNEMGKKVGKVISVSGDLGIGLLRIREALESQKLNVGEIKVETFKPGWWPIQVPKEKKI